MTDTTTAEDLSCMGTMDEALGKLLTAYNNWTPFQGATIATAAGHKAREGMAREAEHRLVVAASLVGWHLKRDEELRASSATSTAAEG